MPFCQMSFVKTSVRIAWCFLIVNPFYNIVNNQVDSLVRTASSSSYSGTYPYLHRSTIANTTDTTIISFPCSFSFTSLNIQRTVRDYSTNFLIICQYSIVSISRLKIL